MSKSPYFRTRSCKQCVSGFETLQKSARHNYYQIFPSIWDKLSWKKPVLVISETLGFFFNTLTAEYMYSRSNMQNLQQQLQTQLSQKREVFSEFFITFLKCTSGLECFEKKKDQPSSLSIPVINDSKVSGYLNV